MRVRESALALVMAVVLCGSAFGEPGDSQPAANPTAPPVPAGPVSPPGSGDRNTRRLFERFIEDAAVTPGGWIEGQYVYERSGDGTIHSAGPLIAFKVIKDLEAGLRFAFLDLHPKSGPRDSGLSDIDLYVKYRLPGGGPVRFGLGGLFKTATADETTNLGTGASDFEIFGALRADLDAVTLVANLAARHNGDPDRAGPGAKDSVLFGGGLLLPASPRITLSVEATWESTRIEGGSDDARLTVGLQKYGAAHHGGFRGAVAFPLSDGAPDLTVFLGAFYTY